MYRLTHGDRHTVDDAVFGLRYRIYVEEMNRPQADADHVGRRIVDKLDDDACHILAYFGDEIVGCMRINRVGNLDRGAYEDYYQLNQLTPEERAGASIITRFMVLNAHRRRNVVFSILRYAYMWGLQNDVLWAYMDCNQHLIGFFEKIGYEKIRPFRHPEYGMVQAMRLEMRNIEKLRALNSIYAESYDLAGIYLPHLRAKPVESAAGADDTLIAAG